MLAVCGFFFSSRRRHTRWTGDWSSDVCSSDLAEVGTAHVPVEVFRFHIEREYICENCVHRAAYVFDRRTRQIRSRRERCVTFLFELQSFFRIRFVHGIANPVGMLILMFELRPCYL